MTLAVLPATADQTEFRDALIAAGVLIETGAPGLYGRGSLFEEIRERFDAMVTSMAADEAPETMQFPPVLPHRQLVSNGYLASFPHLAGSVFAFDGDEQQARVQSERAEHGEDWSEFQRMSEFALVPAACHSVYPAVARRGALPPHGVLIDTGPAWVFRHEPAEDPARLVCFRQRELVRIGPPDEVLAWRDRCCERGLELLRRIGLPAEADNAADPFFGRSGRMLTANQRNQALKYELLVPIAGPEATAVASFNYHQDHFARTNGLVLEGGGGAHSACLGYGEERIVLALLRHHGFDPAGWPAAVRMELWEH